jgi:ACT domain-containing protein
MRRSVGEKMEIIRIVEDSQLSVKRTLQELGISRSTFYEWYSRVKNVRKSLKQLWIENISRQGNSLII